MGKVKVVRMSMDELYESIGFEDKPEPKWKRVDCPTCDSKAGQSCGKIKLGTVNTWIRTAPHAARKRLV